MQNFADPRLYTDAFFDKRVARATIAKLSRPVAAQAVRRRDDEDRREAARPAVRQATRAPASDRLTSNDLAALRQRILT